VMVNRDRAWQSVARLGTAWPGEAQQARRGEARQGEARQGTAGKAQQARQGTARIDERYGTYERTENDNDCNSR